MKKRSVITTVTLTSVLALTACGGAKSKNIVDTKVNVLTPGGATCFLLEIDRMSGAGEDISERFMCVTKEEWDANNVGDEWVDAAGKKKT